MSELDDLRAQHAEVQSKLHPLLDESVRLSKAIDELIVEGQGGWFVRRYWYHGAIEEERYATLDEAQVSPEADFDGAAEDVLGPDETVYKFYRE